MYSFRELLKKIEGILRRINICLVFISAVALFWVVFMIVLDVSLRFLFNSPLPASIEISQLLEAHIVFLPFAYTLVSGNHVRVSLITERLTQKALIVNEFFVYAIDAVFFGLLTYWSWLQFWESVIINEIMNAAVRLPWWSGKIAMPIGLLLIFCQCLYYITFTLNEHLKTRK